MESGESGEGPGHLTRRRVLSGGVAALAAAAIGGAGDAVGSGRAQAADGDDHAAVGAASTPLVSTRGHFVDALDDGLARASGVGPTEYDAADDVPALDGTCPETLLVYVHGFGLGRRGTASHVDDAAAALREAGYDGATVGFSWDAAPGPLEFDEATHRARANGAKLGQFLLDVRESCPETTLVVCGHSLGASVVLHALAWLDVTDDFAETGAGVVESVHLFGAAVHDTVPSRWARRLARVAGWVTSYWHGGDRRLRAIYGTRALGAGPVAGDPPPNVADEDVTDEISRPERGYLAAPDGGATPVATRVVERLRTAGNVPTRGVAGGGPIPTSTEVDLLLELYEKNRGRLPLTGTIVGDGPIAIRVVPSVSPADRTPAARREVLTTFAVECDGGRAVGWEEGEPESARLTVYGTRRSLRAVATADEPGLVLHAERGTGDLAIRGNAALTTASTGAMAYAVDTRETVTAPWREVLAAIRTGVGV